MNTKTDSILMQKYLSSLGISALEIVEVEEIYDQDHFEISLTGGRSRTVTYMQLEDFISKSADPKPNHIPNYTPEQDPDFWKFLEKHLRILPKDFLYLERSEDYDHFILTLKSGAKRVVTGRQIESFKKSKEKTVHPSTEAILKFFEYEHLPDNLQRVSAPICELAHDMAQKLPDGPEKTAGLRKLLEAKDCFVRTLV